MYQILTTDADGQIASVITRPKFSPGQIVSTPGALAAMEEHQCSPLTLLARHLSGDWGSVPVEDARLNDQALQLGGRLMSSYTVGDGVTIWLITDRPWESSAPAIENVTTFLMPYEY